ncbi:hypothetical protein KDJ21_002920 [Metabacillus litoralis]|uniref:hypothetical protein n=1 Tax=Metabacillus litoralis TaxID=152268 RepID=UPI001E3BF2B1|nr:hypothetical protein [Metabacillus litoralis]UHA60701.1 hypothetical protein KDJ21_002920 [Metabacillus litoralis]
MFNQIRKIIEKIKGDNIFCSLEDEAFILKYLKEEENISPFTFKETDEKGKELLEFLMEFTKKSITIYNEHLPKDKRKKNIFLFVDDKTINAFATSINNIDVVGINIGVLTILYDFYNKVVDDKFFTEIAGNGEERKNLIFRLQVMSFHYIICHEIGHLYNGHIDFGRLNLMKEIMNLNQSDRFEIIFNKTIELDADAFAMNRMLEFNENLIAVKDKSSVDNEIKYSYKIFLFSMYSFYLFLGETFRTNEIQEDTYFSPAVRQLLNLTIAEEFVARVRPEFSNEVKEITNYLMMEADFTLHKYCSKSIDESSKQIYLIGKLRYFESPELKNEMIIVKKEWNAIRDELQKNARFQLSKKYNI